MSSDPHAGIDTGAYRRLLADVKPHWRAFIFASIGLILVAGTEGAFVALLKPMLDGSFVEHDPRIITWTPPGLILLFLVRGIASFTAAYWMAHVARAVIKGLRERIFTHMLRLPVSYYDATPAGTMLSRLTYDVEQVAIATTDAITILVRDSLTVIVLLGYMFYIDWVLALVLLVGGPPIAQLITWISKRFRRYSSRIQHSVGDVTRIAEETIDGQRVVKTFGGEAYERGRFEQANEENRKQNMKLETTSAASVPIVQLIAAACASGVIYIAAGDAVGGKMSVGTFVSFIGAMMMVLAPMKRLTKINASLQRGIAAADSIFGFLDVEPEPDSGTRTLEKVSGEVRFEGLRFAYNADKGDVLKGIDLELPAGKTVALVGRSGSGKTTLANLLPRFYEPSAGRIALDGVNVREITLESLRSHIALVSQHITLFNDTIANNIAYGCLGGAERADIERAAELAHAMEFIREMPDGLDTLVGENGVLLSGGQRQRLAIARALLKNAPILILDEATSALDSESERAIQDALDELMKDRTTLVIAHRLSTIEGADRIVVLDQGQIIESGSHAELLAADGAYAALHRLQFREEGEGA